MPLVMRCIINQSQWSYVLRVLCLMVLTAFSFVLLCTTDGLAGVPSILISLKAYKSGSDHHNVWLAFIEKWNKK